MACGSTLAIDTGPVVGTVSSVAHQNGNPTVKHKERERLARQRRPKMMKIQLVVTLDPATGNIQLTGPVNDRILVMGLLEMAKVALLSQPAPSSIVVPQPIVGTPS